LGSSQEKRICDDVRGAYGRFRGLDVNKVLGPTGE